MGFYPDYNIDGDRYNAGKRKANSTKPNTKGGGHKNYIDGGGVHDVSIFSSKKPKSLPWSYFPVLLFVLSLVLVYKWYMG